MQRVKKSFEQLLKLTVFWILLFDIGRLIFLLHNRDKFQNTGFSEWAAPFFYSFRLDLATSAMLCILPFLLITYHHIFPRVIAHKMFRILVLIQTLLIVLISSGEINAYPEWNHKLTTRVFTHLLNPDEVVRTADYGMTIWFFVYTLVHFTIALGLMRYVAPKNFGEEENVPVRARVRTGAVYFLSGLPLLLICSRGGLQPIPITIDSAYCSKNYAVNDLSVNSVYFFSKSLLLYNRSTSGAEFPRIKEKQAKQELGDLYAYPIEHEQKIFSIQRPNLVFLILESWTANAVGSISGEKGATPNFDRLSQDGLLFTRIYATGGTSEIGNSSIFSGYPALPEISVSMQPDKHRKIPSLNQDLKRWGYTSRYIFSGDLKYGNIGGYFIDHGFDKVEDENDFPGGLKRGKLNYYDEDLYSQLLKRIREVKPPFLYGAFTGSTHSPYDHPKGKTPVWKGSEKDFMTSLYYADECLMNFMKKAQKEKWYKNTVFILVADHGHASPSLQNPNLGGYFHVPLLIFGEPLKMEYRGKRIDKLGSQADIVRTLLYQMDGEVSKYKWSKDLLNPKAPEFALHTIHRGFGWITPEGNFSYNMDTKLFPDNTFDKKQLKKERNRCHAYMSLIYDEYLKL
jgi:phosphoglycerol transferase MdoB-like AlkP superfamily enzyme